MKQSKATKRVTRSGALGIPGGHGRSLRAAVVACVLAVSTNCSVASAPRPALLPTLEVSLPRETEGTLAVLTYNVAGLPAMFSPSDPDVNTRQASPHFNRYDIVLAQEDFSYHEDLVHAAQHPFQLPPENPGNGLVGDGLATLSNFPVTHQARQSWRVCSGYLLGLNDCLGDKGFSVAHVDLGANTSLHVYNLHADAGKGTEDVLARAAGFTQLAEFIQRFSSGAALIVGGDTNLDPADPRDQAILEQFMRRTGLTDACLALGCAERQIDKILFRSSRSVTLNVEHWTRDETFADDTGAALSDHPAIAARFSWRLLRESTPPSLATLTTGPAVGAKSSMALDVGAVTH